MEVGDAFRYFIFFVFAFSTLRALIPNKIGMVAVITVIAGAGYVAYRTGAWRKVREGDEDSYQSARLGGRRKR